MRRRYVLLAAGFFDSIDLTSRWHRLTGIVRLECVNDRIGEARLANGNCMLDLRRVVCPFIVLYFTLCHAAAAEGRSDRTDDLIARGVALRDEGRLDLSVDTLALAATSDASPDAHLRAEGELGASLFQAHRYDEAKGHLEAAYGAASGTERARYAIDLGNLAVVKHDPAKARQYFDQGLVSGDGATRISAELNLARLTDAAARLSALSRAASDIAGLADPTQRARLALNAGDQAAKLGTAGLRLAYGELDLSRSTADAIGDKRLAVESRDALAALYEGQHRPAEALRIDHEAMALARNAPPGSVADLLISLAWRDARLLQQQGDDSQAIAAYRRAVDQIQLSRQDIPIDYQDGSSSFLATLEPVYLGLVDLLFKRANGEEGAARDADLRAIKSVLELSKQAEMQDYLGDRCTVDALRAAEIVPPQGTAFLYPVLLPDRVELLLETPSGMSRASVGVSAARMTQVTREFAEALRADASDYRTHARELYDWLLLPLDGTLTNEHINTLIVVSDGVLRLVPFAALYDGKEFAIERFSIATVTGLSMTNVNAPPKSRPRALVAGLSEPGPVVEKLDFPASSQTADAKPGAAATGSLRGARMARATSISSRAQEDAERQSLALPGVLDEVNTLNQTLAGKELLNGQFTEARFSREAGSGRYSIVHIASHGFFGGSANDSFILTYDELLTLSDLQGLLASEEYHSEPIEILSLSACETAEGDARSPLGISGAAMKARAKSVLGTLWPVDDDSARVTMEAFYARLADGKTTKVDALRAAQLELLRNPRTADPFYWAPFVLIGNWL